MAIDQDFKILQHKEEHIDVFNFPYQSLKPLTLMAAGRARTRAEWGRLGSNKRHKGPLEIDPDISQVSSKLTQEEKCIVRTALCGGRQAKKQISDYIQDYDHVCDYCHEADSTTLHVRWVCKYIKAKREEIDPELAAIPIRYFTQCVRNGIAPAMKLKGECTYWGMSVDDGETKKTKKLLGVDMELHTPGKDAEQTRDR